MLWRESGSGIRESGKKISPVTQTSSATQEELLNFSVSVQKNKVKIKIFQFNSVLNIKFNKAISSSGTVKALRFYLLSS